MRILLLGVAVSLGGTACNHTPRSASRQDPAAVEGVLYAAEPDPAGGGDVVAGDCSPPSQSAAVTVPMQACEPQADPALAARPRVVIHDKFRHHGGLLVGHRTRGDTVLVPQTVWVPYRRVNPSGPAATACSPALGVSQPVMFAPPASADPYPAPGVVVPGPVVIPPVPAIQAPVPAPLPKSPPVSAAPGRGADDLARRCADLEVQVEALTRALSVVRAGHAEAPK